MFFFFFNDTATTEIYTLSLHDALPILIGSLFARPLLGMFITDEQVLVLAIELLYIVLWSGLLLGCFIALSSIMRASGDVDRKSTRLNSSHSQISYAVFCLKKKKTSHSY